MSIQKWFRVVSKAQYVAKQFQASKGTRIPRTSPASQSSPHLDDRPHAELGWTVEEVRIRYLPYYAKHVPVQYGAPLKDAATDQHKKNCIMYLRVPRWGLFCTLFITFNERNNVIELQWHLEDLQSFPKQAFEAIESKLGERLGTPRKSKFGRIVEIVWRGEQFETCLTAKIGNSDASEAGVVTVFTGYRDAESCATAIGNQSDETPFDINQI